MAWSWTSLPSHGTPSLISEVVACSPNQVSGKSVRVVGRVEHYAASANLAILSEPNKPGKLLVDARLTDASDLLLGSLVMLIGELGVAAKPDFFDEFCPESGNRPSEMTELHEQENGATTTEKDQEVTVLTARASHCADRLDYTQYCRAVLVWKEFAANND